ncbi:PREDICTED: chitinase 2-like [Populus euphratica]|uniref:Chitinase 2-like n=1 Tax=Populus euphratica TaxID=75702 RepID=A0AAJ6XMB7_POPEU|nr:PREDICTED: chitinase 2-like [Populus euphratica]
MGFREALLITSVLILFFTTGNAANSKLFREYIGAMSSSIKLSDVPVSSHVEFHFIIAFAIDYTGLENPSPTNGKFNAFWASTHVTPEEIASVKDKHSNVKVAVSLGGDSVGSKKAFFAPKSIDSWVQNAISSLTRMIKQYNLDGIDIDYEHFKSDPRTFAECVGRLITTLKKSRTISFASIAPYDDGEVQSHYLALWKKYGHAIDHVNFQFYAYKKSSVSQFVKHFDEQASNYRGGQILASFSTDDESEGALDPDGGFFEACKELKGKEKLGGIFIWSADNSKKHGFEGEKKSQHLLAA